MENERKILTEEEKRAMLGFTPPPQEEKQVEEQAESGINPPPNTEVKTETIDLDLSIFDKKFGRKIESEDTLKSLFEKADKYEEVETSKRDLEQKLTEYQNLAERLDPMSNFLNEDEYVRQQFLKKNKDKFEEDVVKALSTLSPSKVKNLSNEEALKTALMVENGLTGEEAEAYLFKKYDVESFDFNDMDLGLKAQIKVDVKNAKERLAKLYDGIDIPQKVDWETARTQVKQSWEKPLDEIVKGIKTIKLDEEIDFVVTDEMKAGLYDSVLSELVAKQTKPSKEVGEQLYAALQDKIVLSNMDKVIKSMKADIYEKAKEQLRKEVHNDKPLNESSRTGSESEDNDSKVLRLL